jgi:alkylation response protein AidB-like acyl-CoA dehydrogenase
VEWDLPDSHRALREDVERLGEELLGPRAADLDARGGFPRENMDALAEHGICSLMLDPEVGGLGLDHRALAMVCETMARFCASTTMVYVMHTCAAQTVHLMGDADQKERYLRPIRERGEIATLSFSEPATGGHFWYCVSQAKRMDGGYVLDAEKSFTTSAGHADWYVVETRAPDSDRPEDLDFYLVRGDAEGVAAGNWRALGMNGNASGPMTFRNVLVPEHDLLGEHAAGRYWNDNVIDPVFLLASSACWLGIAQGAFEHAVVHTSKRTFLDFQRRLAEYQVPRSYLAQCQIKVDSVRLMVYWLAQRLDDLAAAGRPHQEALYECWETKVHASDTVIDVTNLALQLTGGLGYKAGPVERFLRDGRAGAVMAPSNELCRDWIGKTLVGMPLGYWYEDRDPAAAT